MSFSAEIINVKNAGRIPVIADFKRISPKDGELFQGRSPQEAAKLFERLGAPCLSVVTEPHDFGGSLALLEEIVSAVSLPVLRKDFIRRPEQVKETAACGAAAVLLICACMTPAELYACYETALSVGIEPLIEAHTESELRLAAGLEAKLVGINNRDILSLERDSGTVNKTCELASLSPSGALLISESGIETAADVKEAVDAGADAVLVGTALWKAPDMAVLYLNMSNAGD